MDLDHYLSTIVLAEAGNADAIRAIQNPGFHRGMAQAAGATPHAASVFPSRSASLPAQPKAPAGGCKHGRGQHRDHSFNGGH